MTNGRAERPGGIKYDWVFCLTKRMEGTNINQEKKEYIFKEETTSIVWGRVNLRGLQEIHVAT